MNIEESSNKSSYSRFRARLYEIIFEADTPKGKLFDVALLVFIFASVIVVMLETVEGLGRQYHDLFITLEWIFTVFFTLEYIVRIYTVQKPSKYIFSFFGLVDLLSVVPTYLSLLLPGTQSLLVIRALRLLRVFRIFKLGNFLFESKHLMKALKDSRSKITVFLVFILIIVTIFGSLMYVVEGGINSTTSGFDSIPRSIYWAIVTLTTVGYGDISPQTWLGQVIASIIMILGYSVIAIPTGIVTSEFAKGYKDRFISKNVNTQICSYCMLPNHDNDANYCKRCGGKLHPLGEKNML